MRDYHSSAEQIYDTIFLLFFATVCTVFLCVEQQDCVGCIVTIIYSMWLITLYLYRGKIQEELDKLADDLSDKCDDE